MAHRPAESRPTTTPPTAPLEWTSWSHDDKCIAYTTVCNTPSGIMSEVDHATAPCIQQQTTTARLPDDTGFSALAWTPDDSGLLVAYSVQELRGFELLTPSMRTLGGEVARGRWGRSAVDGSLRRGRPS
jgi:hypothetical protein